MKTNTGLVEYCKAQLGNPYWYGTFGQVATEALLRQKSIQYPNQYRWTDFVEQYGRRVFDCVGLIKGYKWSDTINSNPVYIQEQDKDVSRMKKEDCITGTIKTLPEVPGILVFMEGHVGVYIGNGEVIEARGHLYGVVKTKLKDRPWTEWGKLKWLRYQVSLKLFEKGQGYEALEFLVEQGRITNKDKALKKIAVVSDEDWTYIKWANDVIKLNYAEGDMSADEIK